jgi:hypothetical protein
MVLIAISLLFGIIYFVKRRLPRQFRGFFHTISIDLKLEKNEYIAGESVKGTISILVRRKFIGKRLRLSVTGSENTAIRAKDNDSTSYLYQSYNNIFENDLSRYLVPLISKVLPDLRLEILPGCYTIPFEFTIPNSSLESYEGKYANIRYQIAFKLDGTWKEHLKEMVPFKVMNPNLIDHEIDKQKWITDIKQTEKEHLIIDIEDSSGTHPGEVLRGKLTLNNYRGKKIKGAQIILSGIEHASARLHHPLYRDREKLPLKEKTTVIEQYKNKVKWNGENSVPFELRIPVGIKRCYNGTFFKYYWFIEIEIEIARGKDVHGSIFFGAKPNILKKYSKASSFFRWLNNHPIIIRLIMYAVSGVIIGILLFQNWENLLKRTLGMS